MNNKSNKKTFWPYGIVLSIIACIIACVATIVISLDYPVEYDNFYLQKHQQVNEDINKILASQKEFEKKFIVNLNSKNLDLNKTNFLNLQILPKKDSAFNLKYKILLTRPETNSFNKDLNASFVGRDLSIEKFVVNKPGRWQLMLKLSDENTTGFYKFELFAK